MGLTTIRDIIAELTRQAAEHQGRRLRLIKQITTDPTYQASPYSFLLPPGSLAS